MARREALRGGERQGSWGASLSSSEERWMARWGGACIGAHGAMAIPVATEGRWHFAKKTLELFPFLFSIIFPIVDPVFQPLINLKFYETLHKFLIYHFATLVKSGAQLDKFGRTNLFKFEFCPFFNYLI